MTLRFLLDGAILVEPLRSQPNANILARLRAHEMEIATAAVVWYALNLAAARLPLSAQRSTVERYLSEVVESAIPILGYTAQAAEWHAAEIARLGPAVAVADFAAGQIAAIAAVNDLTLVTLHRAPYALFRGIALADWRLPLRPE